MVGSTLGDVNENSILCGAGAISINQRIRNKPYKIISVRGPLTRELCIKQGIDCPPVYGDPAMLLPLFYNPRPSTYIHTGPQKVGLIPHYVDKENGIVKQLAKNQEIHVIDILLSPNKFGKMSVENEWKKWIDELCSCDCVISSSLHGLIIAEAYGIPTLWVKFSDKINGDDFKFYDYYASIGLSVPPLDLREKEIGFEELQGLITYKDTSIIDKKEYLQTLKMSINILFP
jgi:pyruvyltransferase